VDGHNWIDETTLFLHIAGAHREPPECAKGGSNLPAQAEMINHLASLQ